MAKKSISVIIAARNCEKTIGECIESLLRQNSPPAEIIAVNDGSTDSTMQALKEFEKKNKKIRIIDLKERKTIGYARNEGIKKAKSELIAFIDSDCTAERNWLEELEKCFLEKNAEKKEKIAGAGGPNLTPKNSSTKEKISGEVLEFFSGVGSHYIKNSDSIIETKHNPSCNSIYKKEALLEEKGFNESLSSNEDPELDFRLRKKGYGLLFNPKAIAWHHRKDSAGKFFRQAFWFGFGRMQAIKLHAGMSEWFRFAPPIAIALLAFFGIASFFSSTLYFIFLFFLLFLVLFFLLTAFALSKKNSLGNFADYFLFSAAWFFGYGFGMLKGVVK